MHVIVDSREQLPYTFSNPCFADVSLRVEGLKTGDYSIVGLVDRVAIERKTLDDLAICLTRERTRFERELERSRDLDFFAIVVEGDLWQVLRHGYRSRMHPKSFTQSIFAFMVRYGVQIVWAGNRGGGEYATYSLLQKFTVEIAKEKRAELGLITA